MKFITSNKKLEMNGTTPLSIPKQNMIFRNKNQHSNGTNHPWKYNDPVSDSDTTPKFQVENR